MPLTAAAERRRLTLADLDLKVTCPAGRRVTTLTEGPACVCAITDSVITAAKDPGTLDTFCMAERTDGLGEGGYPACPVWRDAREREWERRRTVLEEPEGADLAAATRRNYGLGKTVKREFYAEEE